MIIFAMVMVTSCDDDLPIDEPVVDPIITHTELLGQWNFVSFQHSDGNFYEYPYDCGDYGWYGNGDMEDWTINQETIDAYDMCEETLYDNKCYILDLKLNEIQFIDCMDDNMLDKFKIIEYDSTTKILVIKKISSYRGMGQWNGILTLQKQ